MMLIPSFVTNALAGNGWRRLIRDPAAAVAIAGRRLSGHLDGGMGSLRSRMRFCSPGCSVLCCASYSLISLTSVRVPAPGAREKWLSPVIGLINGTLTGLTGSFVVPATLYLQALGLDRNVLIQAMGVLYTVSTVALGIALAGNRLLPQDLGVISVIAVLPALAGMVVGQRVRQSLSETAFRKVFFSSLLVLGLYIMGRAFI